MLINSEIIQNILTEYNIKIKGVLHLGAHNCEELWFYQRLGLDVNKEIIWIEAIPEKVEEVKKRGIVAIYNEIISDKDNEEITFNIANNGQSSSFLNLKTHLIAHPDVKYINSFKSKTITLNTFYKKNNLDKYKYNFWNFDIQGAELLALNGANNILPNVDILYLEVNEKELYENCGLITDIDTYLDKFKFKRVHTHMTNFGWGDAIYIKNIS